MAECEFSSRRVCAWLVSSCLLALSTRAIMSRHSVPALYLTEVLIIPASVVAVTQPRVMAAAHAAAESLDAHTALLICMTVAGLAIHHSSFALASCTRYLTASPLTDSEAGQTQSHTCSSVSPDRLAGAEPLSAASMPTGRGSQAEASPPDVEPGSDGGPGRPEPPDDEDSEPEQPSARLSLSEALAAAGYEEDEEDQSASERV
jgi:hypothetical protein